MALTKEMSRPQLQDALGVNHRQHFVAAYLSPALKAGLIEMTFPDKRTSRNQRYRRTAVGESLVQEIKGKSAST